jgi:hypothetical protein
VGRQPHGSLLELARKIHESVSKPDGRGKSCEIHVASRCLDEVLRVSTPRHSRHDRTLRCSPSIYQPFCARNSQLISTGRPILGCGERKLGVCRRIVEAMPDRRNQGPIRHDMLELVMARAFAISCGYKDGNDLNWPRHDPLMKVAVERSPKGGSACFAINDLSRGEGRRWHGSGVHLWVSSALA